MIVDATVVDATPVPMGTLPCEAPQYWPLSLRSAHHPAIVHYRAAAEEPTARAVLGYLDHAWDVEVGELGFRPPLDDGGACGPDGGFDVFLWGGIEECYVDVIGEDASTAWDDRTSYLVVDPWGPYGGAILDTTVAHELNHAMQAADDWSDSAVVYEMTAVFVEDLVYGDDNEYVHQIVDFQAHPDWSLDHDDKYETWYMYGSALYLRFVRDHYVGGDAAWIGAMWKRLRSPYDSGEPDFEDALDAILKAKGVGFVDSVAEFARWRVYTGARDDGKHFREGASFAEPARAATAHTTGATIAIAVMALGSAYVDVAPSDGAPTSATVELQDASSAVRWVVDVVPGANSDGDRLDLSHGPVRIDVSRPRTIVVTALPEGENDPDTRSAAHHHATLVIAP